MTPRSDANSLIEKLLEAVDNDQWSGRFNTHCHCHPIYESCCPSCGVLEEVGEHETGCERKALIDRASAYLRAENELAEARGEDDRWDIP